MIEISNLRTERSFGKTKLIADISSDIIRKDGETTIWVSVDDKNAYMLADDVYDMFLFMPVYMSMYYHTDLHICGCVSKKLYRNVVDYVQPIMLDFSDELSMQRIIIDGHKDCESEASIVGTGISCGVDCFSTIYDRFVKEKDEDYKLTHLFMLNCGWHGKYGDPRTIDLFDKRCNQNKKAADKIGLEFVPVDSNLHAFLYEQGDKASYFNLYSIAFALEKALKRYYISNSYSYDEVSHYGRNSKNCDWSEFADPIAIPLMHSASLQLVSDGCQYTRVEKTKNIIDWEISKEFLNVCCRHSNVINVDETNCSCCTKCNRTLLAIDALGRLNDYRKVFDIEKFNKNKRKIIKEVIDQHERVPFYEEIFLLYKEQGKSLPISIGLMLRRIKRSIRVILKGE